ncbi:MAG: iron ABC transporter permease [Sulfuricella denitrificans]|nr:iron ABC transporter permease [Sulfuricella denitrificans]
MRSRRLLFFGLLLLAPTSILIALSSGSADLSLTQLLHGNAAQQEIFWQLRAPRAASAFACGALLALSGVLLQVLLRNPLADPYLLGISGGAAAGALGAMLLGLAAAIKFSAFGGALIALLLVPALSFRRHAWDIHHLLLTGIALSAGFGALISLLLSIAPSAGIHGMLYWLMGDLSYAQSPVQTWAALLASGLASVLLARHLDVLAIGELKAKSLGIAVLPVQGAAYLIAATATTAAVLEAGSIGFVGLVVPHLLRLLGMDSHRWLIPGAILLGGSFLTLADTLARTLVAPQQLPVGVLTALTGAPLLLFLLSRRR